MNRCDECGFTYADHGPDTVADKIAALGVRYGSRLQAGAGDIGDPAGTIRTRPSEDVWSPLECACHVRDVLLAQRERLLLALVEERPSFAPIYRDQRVVLARYRQQLPERVVYEINVASGLVAWVLVGLDDEAWARTCLYSYPNLAERTLLWLAQHTLHEGEHHLLDIERVIGAPQ